METLTEKSSKLLKDLIIINNDRYEGYKKAAEEVKDPDLKELFNSFSQQSKKFSQELQNALPDKTESPAPNETKNTGKLYRVWMDLKAALAGHDRKTILSSCEFGEDIARDTYDSVLEKPEGLTPEILETIGKQRAEILKGHNKVKALRDSIKNGTL